MTLLLNSRRFEPFGRFEADPVVARAFESARARRADSEQLAESLLPSHEACCRTRSPAVQGHKNTSWP